MGRAVAFMGAAVVVLAVVESRADACQCSLIPAALVWPTPQATGVPLDTTLVVRFSNPVDVPVGNNTGYVTSTGIIYKLTDETGAEVPLRVVRTIESDYICTLQNYGFLRPSTDLAPARRYTLDAQFDGIPTGTVAGWQGTFTTGTEVRGMVAPPAVSLWLFAEETSFLGRLLQVFASAATDDPVFVTAPGAPLRGVRSLGPLAGQDPVSLPLGNVPCAEIEVIDVNGDTFHSEQLCTPLKCSWPTVIPAGGDSICGHNSGGDSWENWQQRPDGCEPPPADGGTGDGAATTDARPATRAKSGGCAAAGAERDAPSWSFLAIAAAIFQSSARRRSRSRLGSG